MLFFNRQTWIIMCTLLSHLDPFINGLLNTGGIGPKLLAWFWEAQRMRRTQDTKHRNTGGYVSAMLTQEGRASSARSDGHSSITAQPAHHGALTSLTPARTLPWATIPTASPRQGRKQGMVGRKLFCFQLSIKRTVEVTGFGIIRKNCNSQKRRPILMALFYRSITKGSGNYILKSRVHSGNI